MMNIGKSKSFKLLHKFEQEGIVPLENIINNPEYPEEKKKEIKERINLYQEVVNNFQKITLTHIHYVVGVKAVLNKLSLKGIITKDNNINIENNDITDDELKQIIDILIDMDNSYEIFNKKIVSSDSDNSITSFINKLNDNNINITIT